MASEKILEQKQAQVDELAAELKAAKTVVLADYAGLSVAQDTELRKNLREADVTYKVIKNNIGKRASEEAGLNELAEYFAGPTAIAYSEDVVAPAKVLYEFSKDNEIFTLKAGMSDGSLLVDQKLIALASVPSVDELQARLARGVAWPMTHLAMIAKALADKLEEEGKETAKDLLTDTSAAAAETAETEENATEAAEEQTAESSDSAAEAVEAKAEDTNASAAETETADSEATDTNETDA